RDMARLAVLARCGAGFLSRSGQHGSCLCLGAAVHVPRLQDVQPPSEEERAGGRAGRRLARDKNLRPGKAAATLSELTIDGSVPWAFLLRGQIVQKPRAARMSSKSRR